MTPGVVISVTMGYRCCYFCATIFGKSINNLGCLLHGESYEAVSPPEQSPSRNQKKGGTKDRRIGASR